jgi:LemA protein
MDTTFLILLAIVAVLVAWFIAIYNGLIRLKVRTDEAWSDIDVQLKRRHDLIPNLINTVKGYAAHESGVFEKVTEARAAALSANTAAEKGQAENALSGTLKTLFAVAEAYPELKANTNFLELQKELADTENKIQASRRFYNGNVRDLNTKIQIFPDNLVASMLGITKRDFFQAEAGEKEVPEVQF